MTRLPRGAAPALPALLGEAAIAGRPARPDLAAAPSRPAALGTPHAEE